MLIDGQKAHDQPEAELSSVAGYGASEPSGKPFGYAGYAAFGP